MTLKKEVTTPPAPISVWEQIKNLPLNVFSLTGQKVESHFTPITSTPNLLVMKSKTPAAIAFLDESINVNHMSGNPVRDEKFSIEQSANGYIAVKRL